VERDLYWTWGADMNRWAFRRGQWKLVKYGTGAPQTAEDWQLFDLSVDPKETTDVSSANPEILNDLNRRFRETRTRDKSRPSR
jgi:arylsulfatase A-like enzyme